MSNPCLARLSHQNPAVHQSVGQRLSPGIEQLDIKALSEPYGLQSSTPPSHKRVTYNRGS